MLGLRLGVRPGLNLKVSRVRGLGLWVKVRGPLEVGHREHAPTEGEDLTRLVRIRVKGLGLGLGLGFRLESGSVVRVRVRVSGQGQGQWSGAGARSVVSGKGQGQGQGQGRACRKAMQAESVKSTALR